MGGEGYAPAVLPPGKKPVPIVQEAGCASVPVWIRPEMSTHWCWEPGPTQLLASRSADYVMPVAP